MKKALYIVSLILVIVGSIGATTTRSINTSFAPAPPKMIYSVKLNKVFGEVVYSEFKAEFSKLYKGKVAEVYGNDGMIKFIVDSSITESMIMDFLKSKGITNPVISHKLLMP